MKTNCLFVFFNLLVLLVCGQDRKDSIALYFPSDKAQLTADGKRTLEKFVANLNSGKTYVQLLIKGFTDNKGAEQYNNQLSDQRVQAVYDYLLQQGMLSILITFRKGYGEQVPINANSTAEQRQQNRRVDVIGVIRDSLPAVSLTPAALATIAQPIKQDTSTHSLSQAIQTVKIGETLRLKNINFHGGSEAFLPESATALQELYQVMKTNPKLVIEIQGHICCLSKDSYTIGESLSHRRAKAVYNFLLESGIRARRMSYTGFDSRYPLVYPEHTEEDRIANRRVEIKVVKR